ncbi:hypothetical protein FDB50_15405 [Clostridium botulinum]|uniref:Uncharacterized protein n=1 Tax=Clostridium botulinum TaxID=1491 RepID=A0A846JTU1_CLOBO|nr:hypothetical protein [Clostridium botulinum]NFN06090.1 hypothetical protein [Clostridium botulinum]NFN36426.1 hypothetical protein [Clostridium botulinum]
MNFKNEKFNIGDWIEISILDCISCFAVILDSNNNELKLYVKQVTGFCYSNQRLISREIQVELSEIYEIVNVTKKVKDLLKKCNSSKSYIELLKKSKGNYYSIAKYLKSGF